MLSKHFFTWRQNIYLDNNATTPISSSVAREMGRAIKNSYGNPSSLYKIGVSSAILLEESRQSVAKAIGASPEDIIFTGSASEANNTVIKIIADGALDGRKKIITTPLEHASILSTLKYLEEKGFEIVLAPINSKGLVDMEVLDKIVDSKTLLVCCMVANNETGVIQDVKRLAAICRNHEVPILADCVQAFGKIPIDVKELGVDYATFSAHKIYGPKGCGALYHKSGALIKPFIHGGHQEGGLRAGTESIHNIIGFSQACKQVANHIEASKNTRQLRDYFIEQLKLIKPDIIVNSPDGNDCLPNTVNVVFTGINNAFMIATLDHFDISVSAGSACNTQQNEPSHVLKAIGCSDDQARESIRFSLGVSTSRSQIKYVLRIIRTIINKELPAIGMVEPKILDEQFLFDKENLVVDVRFWIDRTLVKGIPNSVEVTFLNYKKQIKKLPHNKNIVVVCQTGFNAPLVAYELKKRGCKNVSFLTLGVVAWRQTHPELYEKFGGFNIKKVDE